MATDIELDRALVAISATLNDQRLSEYDPDRVQGLVTGATGNIGTSVLRALADEPRVRSIVGIARRTPAMVWPKTTWARADISRDDLEQHFRDADAVVHLAWLIQPSRDMAALEATNLYG